jgi:hypothetical protein
LNIQIHVESPHDKYFLFYVTQVTSVDGPDVEALRRKIQQGLQICVDLKHSSKPADKVAARHAAQLIARYRNELSITKQSIDELVEQLADPRADIRRQAAACLWSLLTSLDPDTGADGDLLKIMAERRAFLENIAPDSTLTNQVLSKLLKLTRH